MDNQTSIPVIEEQIKHIVKGQERHDEYFKKLFVILEGNGSEGLVTREAKNTGSIKLLWKGAFVILVLILGVALK